MPRKLVEPLTQEEVKQVIDSAVEDDCNYLFLRLLVKTGR